MNNLNLEAEKGPAEDDSCQDDNPCAFSAGVRESMAGLPSWMQPIITLLTGKPMPNEKPSFSVSPVVNMVLSISALITLMALNIFLLSSYMLAGLIMLPITWVVCTGLIRKTQVVFAHHCVHRTFLTDNPKGNDFVLEFLTTLALVQNGEEYRRDHLGHHNRDLFTTRKDSDAGLLYELGFVPGTTKSELWKRLTRVLLSGQLHWIFIKSRFRSNFISRPIRWRVAAMFWAVAIMVGLPMMFPWWQIVVVVWLPLFVFYNGSALIQFLTEHAWMISPDSPADLEGYAERCWGRFFGEPCPSAELSGLSALYQWSRWIARMLFIHVPVRFGCFVGDLPAHDWHHLCTLKNHDPASWPESLFSRQKMIDSGVGLGMEQRELWGLRNMLDHVFLLLETADLVAFTNRSEAA